MAAAAAGSSRFAVTCELLRQYMMREHQQQQGVTGGCAFRLPALSEATAEAEETDVRTMQLFPTRAGTSPPSQDRPEAKAKAALTIFYEGRVVVFEDFPADKAKELMQLAESGSSPAPQTGAPSVPEKPAGTQPSAMPSDLPIARNASLQRFLQKRKHRISANDPYNKATASAATEKDFAAGKPVKDEPPAASWLGL